LEEEEEGERFVNSFSFEASNEIDEMHYEAYQLKTFRGQSNDNS
jgi:hypothetical protein